MVTSPLKIGHWAREFKGMGSIDPGVFLYGRKPSKMI
jgi:hypothetical protein